MAYEAGSTSGQIDLLNKIAAFTTMQLGWTANYNGAGIDVSADKQITLSHVRDTITQYYTLVSRTTYQYPRLRFTGHTGFDNTKNILQQPGAPSTGSAPFISMPVTGIMNYWFFGTQQYLIVIIQIGDWFDHFFIGQANLIGGYTHGFIVCGCHRSYNTPSGDYNNTSATYRGCFFLWAFPDTTISYADHYGAFLDHSGSWVPMYNSSAINTGGVRAHFYGTTTNNFPTHNATMFAPHALNFAPVMYPCPIFVPHPILTNNLTLAGEIPDVYVLAINNILPASDIQVASDTYMVFPFANKNLTEKYNNIGFAVRKIT